MTKTPAKFIRLPMAPDAPAAEKQVAEEHEISETLRNSWWRSARIFDHDAIVIATKARAPVWQVFAFAV
jgi:transposase-like protein